MRRSLILKDPKKSMGNRSDSAHSKKANMEDLFQVRPSEVTRKKSPLRESALNNL